MKRRRGLYGIVAVRVGPAVMEMIGLDRYQRGGQLSIKAEDGTIMDRRIVTSRERFTAVLGARMDANRPTCGSSIVL